MQDIKPMGLSDFLTDYKKIFHKHENVTNIINMKHKKIQGVYPMDMYSPWAESFIRNFKIIKT